MTVIHGTICVGTRKLFCFITHGLPKSFSNSNDLDANVKMTLSRKWDLLHSAEEDRQEGGDVLRGIRAKDSKHCVMWRWYVSTKFPAQGAAPVWIRTEKDRRQNKSASHRPINYNINSRGTSSNYLSVVLLFSFTFRARASVVFTSWQQHC
jgi:hypothetical protein